MDSRTAMESVKKSISHLSKTFKAYAAGPSETGISKEQPHSKVNDGDMTNNIDNLTTNNTTRRTTNNTTRRTTTGHDLEGASKSLQHPGEAMDVIFNPAFDADSSISMGKDEAMKMTNNNFGTTSQEIPSIN